MHLEESKRGRPGDEAETHESFHRGQDLEGAERNNIPETERGVGNRRVVEIVVEVLRRHIRQVTEIVHCQQLVSGGKDKNLEGMQKIQSQYQVENALSRSMAWPCEQQRDALEYFVMNQHGEKYQEHRNQDHDEKIQMLVVLENV